jgi:hypothetical protein
MKYQYVAYGLNIESELCLPGLRSGSGLDLPVVSIRQARSIDRVDLGSRHDGGDFLFLKLPGLLEYWVSAGQELTFWPDQTTDEGVATFSMQQTASGFGLALLLRQRGLLTLHAAVVAKREQAIVFVGESGWGKSTLAEYFSQNGYEVICDDIGAIEITDNEIRVLQGNATIKLRSGSEAILDDSLRVSPRYLDGRLHLPKASVNSSGIPIAHIFLLENSFASRSSIEPLTPTAKIVELIRHTHGAHLLTRPDYQAAHLRQCSDLAKRVPMSVLRRQGGLSNLSTILELVENHVYDQTVEVGMVE